MGARRIGLIGLVALAACGPGTEPATPSAEPPEAPPPVASETSAPTGQLIGHAPEAAEGAPSVIILEPRAALDVPVPTEPAEMDQFGRAFIPRLLVVRLGQPVQFKNSEDDLHTVHVSTVDGQSLFNVAMPIRGGLYRHLFTELGEYPVSCEAHPEMAATIFVVDTPYHAVADRDGDFTIENIVPGTYDLFLRRGSQRHEQEVRIEPGQNTLVLEFPTTGS